MQVGIEYGHGRLMAQRLPPEATDRLDAPEGTLRIGYVLPDPLNQAPPVRTTLLADVSPARTSVRIEIDEGMRVHFVRQAPGREPADVDVDVAPLRGATRLHFWCVWSPTAMTLHVVDRDEPTRTVTGSLP